MPGGEMVVHELVVASQYDNLDEVAAFVEKEAQHAGVAQSDCLDLVMSTTEAVNNAIQHGNMEDQGKRVIVRIESESGRMTIWVKDEGAGFNPGAVPDPTAPPNLMRDSGRGILMMRAFMDEVDFVPWKRGMSVRMIKTFSPDQG
jgi:serine/threonine-protein kinase RsbW